MVEQGGGGSARLNLQIFRNIGQSSAFFLVEGGIIIDWLNLLGGGGAKEGSAFVLTFRKYFF